MKKTFLAILIAASTSVFAQTTNDETPIKKNEIRLNAFNSLLGSVDFQYERFLGDNSSWGLNAGIGYGDEWSELYNPKFNISPNFRLYYSKKRAAGFFIEGNAVFSQNKTSKYAYYDSENITISNFGLGIASGYKLINKSNFITSIKAGIGRYLTHQNNYNNLDPAYPICEISIGKRF